MPEPGATLLINPVSTPPAVARYGSDGMLEEVIPLQGQISEALIPVLEEAIERGPVARIIYVHGPGSNMGIKLTYILLRTLEMTRSISFEACSAFDLSGGAPVRAMGKLYFVKEKETIITRRFDEAPELRFTFPETITAITPAPDREPDYRLPAV
ncbi:hypothetical protein [Nitratifractor sp.]